MSTGSNGGVDVVVDRVTKSFEGGRIVALDEVSLELEPGDFASIVGPSGCGKSTLLNLIGALDLPDSGTIAVGGTDLRHLPDAAELPGVDGWLRVPVPPPHPDAERTRERPGADDRPWPAAT